MDVATLVNLRGAEPRAVASEDPQQSGMPIAGPCSTKSASVRSCPCRGQAPQAISIVAVRAATAPNRMEPSAIYCSRLLSEHSTNAGISRIATA
jgi:hypothetical protein